MDTADNSVQTACQEDQDKLNDKCSGKTTIEEQCKDNDCKAARACILRPHKTGSKKKKEKVMDNGKEKKRTMTYTDGSFVNDKNEPESIPADVNACCPGDQPHHLVEAHSFYQEGERGTALEKKFKASGYKASEAPCVCAKGDRFRHEHGKLHEIQGKAENKAIADANAQGGDRNYAWNYATARDIGIQAHKETFPESECSEKCIKAQLDAYHKDKCKVSGNTKVRTTEAKLTDEQKGRQSVRRKK